MLVLQTGQSGVDLTGSTFLFAITGGQRSRSVFIQQRKQIALIDHVQEVRLILFLILVDGRIVVDDNEEGVATYFLNMVDESDLLALLDEDTAAALTTCNCKEKCVAGQVNTRLPGLQDQHERMHRHSPRYT